jgi:hypothetical protein
MSGVLCITPEFCIMISISYDVSVTMLGLGCYHLIRMIFGQFCWSDNTARLLDRDMVCVSGASPIMPSPCNKVRHFGPKNHIICSAVLPCFSILCLLHCWLCTQPVLLEGTVLMTVQCIIMDAP